MTRRRKEDGRRRKAYRPILTNIRRPHPPRLFESLTRVATHRGRVSATHHHRTQTRAGQTRMHPIATKAKRRRRAKLAAASRRANR